MPNLAGPPPLRIVAVEGIALAREAFGHLGHVEVVPERDLSPARMLDADVLLVRSGVRVDAQLLADARPRLIGTATIGVDHVDRTYLQERGIAFTSAPGSNATSVAEWWSAALLQLATSHGLRLEGLTVGVVGLGNVGRRVCRRARALGLRVLACDPPLARLTRSPWYRPLDELLEAAHILTLHVPLTRGGPDPTHHLVDANLLERLRPGAILINSSRGAVHCTPAVVAALRSGQLSACLLDVWEGEPRVEEQLLDLAAVGTPHIAGYSLDGKVGGTAMLHRALCELLRVPAIWHPWSALPSTHLPRLRVTGAERSPQAVAAEAVLTLYPIAREDAALREGLDQPPQEREQRFHRLRSDYWPRRAFRHTVVELRRGTRAQARTLTGLGFQVHLTDGAS